MGLSLLKESFLTELSHHCVERQNDSRHQSTVSLTYSLLLFSDRGRLRNPSLSLLAKNLALEESIRLILEG